MKKLLLLACLLLVGCEGNVEVADPPIVTVDGIVEDKYEVKNIFFHLIVSVEAPNEDYVYNLKVSEYIYNYYEIGDIIQFTPR